MAGTKVERKQKIHLRGKTRLWRRRKVFNLIRYGLILVCLGWAAKAAAYKLHQANPMPVNFLSVNPEPSSASRLWVEAVHRELKTSWQEKSRFTCLMAAPQFSSRLERNYPYIKKSSVSYLDLLFKGEARLQVIFRSAAAVSQESGSCLDEEGVFFPCPAGEPLDDLIRTRGLRGPELARLIKLIPKLEIALSDKVSHAAMVSGAVIALKTRSARTLKFAAIGAKDLKTFEQSLEKLVTIKKDLDARGDTWRYLDMTLIEQGRIIIGA